MILPKVSVIILNWNGKQDTLNCLESTYKLDYPNYEVLVVDNHSNDDSVAILKARFPQLRIIENDRNYGYCKGNNIGIKYAIKRKASHVFVLNNDVVLHKDCLAELVNAIERDAKIGMVGPKTYFYDRPNTIQIIGGSLDFISGKAKSIGLNEVDVGQFDEPKEFDFINGHAVLVKKELIEQVGLIDEEYFAYNEETDWCFRARKKGYKLVYIPKAVVWHKVSKSTRKMKGDLKTYLIIRNRILFMKKNASKDRLFLFLLYFTFVTFPLLTIRYIFSKNWFSLIALVRGIVWHFGFKSDKKYFFES